MMDFLDEEEPEYPFFNDFRKCVTQFINLSVALLISVVLLRITELALLTTQNSIPADIGKIVVVSLLYDVIFATKILPVIFVLFALVYLNTRSQKMVRFTFGICAILVIILNLLLVKYYATALVPLGADLFGYSINEVIETTAASGAIDLKTVLIFFLTQLALFWVLLYYLGEKKIIGFRISATILAIGVILLSTHFSALPANTSFKTDYSYNLSINKTAFFTEALVSRFNDDEPEVDIYDANYYDGIESGNAGNKPFKYINSKYPFLHVDETEDVLGPFLNINPKQPPNIIIIQVEGLGRAFSGPDAYLGSFTPFLDELASRSLYFKNFLASQGRTFASLPSIMGSLPFAENGYSELAGRMPKHLTLPRILKKNNYTARFYCGVNLEFDHEDIFLQKQGFDHVISEKDFDNSFSKSPSFQGFTWGYADYELITKTLQDEKQRQNQPFLSYIQTVSMHNPFLIPGQQRYYQLFEDHLNKLGFDNKKKEEYKKYKNIYSTILYTDQTLQVFFKEYAKLPSYNNSIFIITGDHRLPEIPMSSKIDRYHVPLIIYSPLLKRQAVINSISSHLDITPSLLALLKQNYSLVTPSSVAWVGAGLDTVRSLRNIHTYPLIQTKNNFHNLISGLFLLDNTDLFSIGENMNLTRSQDEIKHSEMRSTFRRHKNMNERLAKDLRLIPASVFAKFE